MHAFGRQAGIALLSTRRLQNLIDVCNYIIITYDTNHMFNYLDMN